MQFSDYKNMPASEKITLAILMASKRLMGWSLHSGSIYKIENFTFAVIESIEDSGTVYTPVSSIGSVTASKYFLDRATQTLYIRTTGSDNPNSRFIAATMRLFFSNVAVALPYDLSTGFDVPFEPLIKSTSEFGVGMDTIGQISEALEGSGTLTLFNDFDFWPANFDKLTFENQKCSLYAYNRSLDVTDAYLIYKGAVDKQQYTKDTVVFQLKDQFAQLRASVALDSIGDLGARTGDDLTDAKQRMILGRVVGNIPTNIDQVLDGYPITGTVSVSFNSSAVTGVGTLFLAELSPDDQITLNGSQYTVATIASNTSLVLSDLYTGNLPISGASTVVNPSEPKRYINRVFKVAGHALREPVTAIQSGLNVNTLIVDSTRDIYPGDYLYVGTLGSGELTQVDSVVCDNYLHLATSLGSIPANGSPVRRPAIQNVRIDNVALTYYRDYTFDANTAVLTLNSSAEANAAPIKQLTSNISFTSASRLVTGSGFSSVLKPGYMVGIVGNADFFEILSIQDDSNLTLRTASTFTATANIRFKSLIYDEGSTVLTLDALGKTDDDTSDGVFIKTAPAMSLALLQHAGLEDLVDESTFEDAEDLAYQELGIVVPENYNETDAPTYRDTLNSINKSVFGSLIQDSSFRFAYTLLRPTKLVTYQKFNESDVLKFELTATSENVVKTAIVEYAPREYDYLVKDKSLRTKQNSSDNATYLIKTDVSRTISTCLANAGDAEIIAGRWGFILQNSTSRLSFDTKLQGINVQVGDVIEIEHRKFFERFGGSGKRKLLLVEDVKKSGATVSIEATDLSNTFNRVCTITGNTLNWDDATSDEHFYTGYYTDQYGLINNDPDTFGINLIW